jgi:hypothetical protein
LPVKKKSAVDLKDLFLFPHFCLIILWEIAKDNFMSKKILILCGSSEKDGNTV